jgi:hypothetical protein
MIWALFLKNDLGAFFRKNIAQNIWTQFVFIAQSSPK